ncbi:glutamine--fructose-6-phosphate transaminase (isomerizing) [Candidatus Thiothrix sp. Deng01]|uniref:Glutamine--fructose-6-phosphate aminotransferase [isomerizing] n=1 Tax=Candidatus Thiothrix phosphatis TaxID=3112415 RepID=A0ABU6CUB3_9GAMM|nr:glutamine--fructose-6-phosphate transaminase (isomerizing) [Candidatus Thiothrix sp. Deng01]MEB4590430.1 glutamine--fructose-6-phosphate transaminase (isomerizing) [Candidatus Thiothrix sp. Deng01]
MCGIVGAIAQRPVVEILLEGLRRLEYRGYDSAGVAVVRDTGELVRSRSVGKVAALTDKLAAEPIDGKLGIAHTRWATHGAPAERNAHPHFSGEWVGIVHNGIIENHAELRQRLQNDGYRFDSDTDTEVIAHLIDVFRRQGVSLLDAVMAARSELQGAYALAVISPNEPDTLIVARQGSPLVIGLGIGENFIASDIQALLPVTSRFIYLQNGDVAKLNRHKIEILDVNGERASRPVKESGAAMCSADLGEYRHFMLKEIFEQPQAVAATLENRLAADHVLPGLLGAPDALEKLAQVEEVQIIACGTSYHAGLVGRYWIEANTDIPCHVEVASEYRYRRQPPRKNMLFVTISQSGETADTLAALEKIKENQGCMATLTICNVAESSLTRESDMALMTLAGPEIGVASTKAFTTQLVALQLLMALLMQAKGADKARVAQITADLRKLPALIEQALELNPKIEVLAERFLEKHHALFLGRGELYPVAMEGALKLKEISYIHAEAYPAGELKHGPLALVDSEMPIVTVAPSTGLLEKLKSNLEEVRSRGGELYVFADREAHIRADDSLHVLEVPPVPELLAPIVYTAPLQLLSYHVAVQKGTDVDKPRNLAKSVTVE